MERIVVGIDESASSDPIAERVVECVVEWVSRRAHVRDVEVELVTAIDLLMSDPLDVETRLSTVRDAVLRLAPNSVIRTAVIEGAITNVLKERSRNADLLLIGSRRSRPVRLPLAGSLPLRLASGSSCPTIILPDVEAEHAGARNAVVVGLESDHSSDAALDWAAREALAGNHELRIVHAWRLPPTPYAPFEAVFVARPEEIAWHRHFLAETAHDISVRYPGLEVCEQLSEAFPASVLAEAAQGAALLVVGTHGRGPIGSLVFGSTADTVLRTIATPLCVVPNAEPVTAELTSARTPYAGAHPA